MFLRSKDAPKEFLYYTAPTIHTDPHRPTPNSTDHSDRAFSFFLFPGICLGGNSILVWGSLLGAWRNKIKFFVPCPLRRPSAQLAPVCQSHTTRTLEIYKKVLCALEQGTKTRTTLYYLYYHKPPQTDRLYSIHLFYLWFKFIHCLCCKLQPQIYKYSMVATCMFFL